MPIKSEYSKGTNESNMLTMNRSIALPFKLTKVNMFSSKSIKAYALPSKHKFNHRSKFSKLKLSKFFLEKAAFDI
jgi:hypothetical protein